MAAKAAGRRGALAVALLAVAAIAVLESASAEERRQQVVVVELDAAIDNVSARFLRRSLEDAANDGAAVVIVRVDTPGGLLSATRDMVGAIFGSRVPVVAYVAPDGAQAASAGTFVAAATSLLAMAPTTNLGAAAVVGGGGEDLPETLGRKVTEDAAALIRGIATRRGRPVEPLEATVREARSYSAGEALALHIADLVEPDLAALLAALDGRTLAAAGGDVRVETAGAVVRTIDMNVFERVLSFLADPNVAFLLISLGALALAVEVWSPGLWVPGAIGLISLILGFAGVGNLPFSWAAVALLGLAVAFYVLEALHPGIGLFGAFGTVALVLGGLFMLGVTGPPAFPGSGLQVNRWLLVGIGAVTLLLVVLLAREFRLSHRQVYVSPFARERLLGELAEVSVRLAPRGEVRLAGEAWSAELRGASSADVGERVRVMDLSQLGLLVEPAESRESETTEAVHRPEQPGR